jgi:hypothetical protein
MVKNTKQIQSDQSKTINRQVRIGLEPTDNVSVYYANYIEVANSIHDFSLFCSRVPAKLTTEKIEEINNIDELVLEPEVQIIIPTTLVPGLIRALTTQRENYERALNVKIDEIAQMAERPK